MGEFLYYLIYGLLFVLFFYDVTFNSGSDHFFSPWPGYPFLFSTYFLVGTITSNDAVPGIVWWLYIAAIFGFYLGAGLAKNLYNIIGANAGFSVNFFISTINFKIIGYLVVVSMGITFFLWGAGGIPFFSDNVDDARMSYASSAYAATLATTLDVSAVFCAAFLLFARGGDSSKRFFCLFVVILFVVVAILSGSRSRLMKLVVPFFVIYSISYKKINVFYLLFFGIFGLFFIGAIGFYRAYSLWGEGVWPGLNQEGVYDVVDAVIYYATIELRTAVYGLSIVVDRIPEYTKHTYGILQISPLIMPLPFNTPTPGMFFKDMIGGTWHGAGLAATFISPMYADFGVFGVVFSCFVISLFMSVVYSRAVSGGYDAIYYSVLYAILFFFLLAGIRSDFVSFEFIWFLSVAVAIIFFRVGGVRVFK